MITIRQLAELAGVSPATVSKALNDQSDVSERMKEYIVKLARDNGYVKRSAANSGGTAFSGMRVGILFTDQTSKYYSNLLMRFNERIAEEKGIVFTVDTLFSDQRAIDICHYFEKTRMVDGIICIAALENNLIPEQFRVPIVSCSVIPVMETYSYDYIFVNEETGIDEAIRTLLDQGHKRFAYLGERHSGKRHAIFRRTMERWHISEENRYEMISDLRYEKAGYTLMKELLKRDTLPSAIFCDYDDMAVGAGQAIMEAGFSVPKDFSIVAVDNSQLVLNDQKIISSVDCNINAQVDIALSLLRKRIKDPDAAIQNISLLSKFINADTVGPRPEWVNRPDE